MTRQLDSWINSYIQHTNSMGSPEIFCKWTALATVAGVLERKVWLRTARGVMYPNMYTILIGEPGVGKSLQTDLCWELWNGLSDIGTDTHWTAVQSLTFASLIDQLHAAERKLIRPQDPIPIVSFNSLLIAVNELSILLPEYAVQMMAKLTDLWDCKVYGEARRGTDTEFSMENPQLNILSATTPAQLFSLLPEGAWDQGFLSRVMLVYSGEMVEYDLWDIPESHTNGLWPELRADLSVIGNLYGEMYFSEDAAVAVNAWQKAKGPPRPNHPKLARYNNRRTHHLLKLCMITCAAHGDDLTITLDHYVEALDSMLELEKSMPDIFKAMTSGGDAQVIQETWHYAYTIYMRTKKPEPIRESLLVQFVSERASSHNVMRILDVMIRAGLLKPVEINRAGTCYVPKERKEF